MRKKSKEQKEAFLTLKTIDPDVEIREDEITGTPVRIRGILSEPKEGDPETIAREFLSKHRGVYGITAHDEELQLKKIGVDENDNRHVRFHQKFKGLPVFGSEMIVHMNSDNVIVGTNGAFIPEIDIPDKPNISPEEAVKKILKDDPSNSEWTGATPLLLVLLRDEKLHLAWHLSVKGTDKDLAGKKVTARWEYFLDALTGKVIWRYNNLKTHDATTGSGTGTYVAGPINTSHDHAAGTYCLIDKSLPTTARIYTHDAKNGLPGPVSCDPDNTWNGSDQSSLVDSHVFTRRVFDYYYLQHGRNSFDNAGGDMHIHARFNLQNNAYWDGTRVVIGYGDGVKKGPYPTLDTVAHEWTHGVTDYEANLIYDGESGALNESFSDVFACLIDGDWLYSEDNWLMTSEAPASRNLQDPTNGGKYNPADPLGSVGKGHQPDHMNDKYTGANDNHGVHINSGIMNKAAYLIAVGGYHRGIKICTGLGSDRLGKIYYDVLCNHLTASSTFTTMKDAVLDALHDLYAGYPNYDKWRISVINAFAAVGIGTADTCPAICVALPHIICPPKPHIICPPKPSITCPPIPSIICPPKPYINCPPKPYIVCHPGPGTGGCLPGPDPGPFGPGPEPGPFNPHVEKTERKSRKKGG